MATEMTPELNRALEQSGGIPVELVDPRDQEHYVVIPAKMYETLKGALAYGDLTEEEKKAQLQAWGRRAGWEDPEASVFDDLKPL